VTPSLFFLECEPFFLFLLTFRSDCYLCRVGSHGLTSRTLAFFAIVNGSSLFLPPHLRPSGFALYALLCFRFGGLLDDPRVFLGVDLSFFTRKECAPPFSLLLPIFLIFLLPSVGKRFYVSPLMRKGPAFTAFQVKRLYRPLFVREKCLPPPELDPHFHNAKPSI